MGRKSCFFREEDLRNEKERKQTKKRDRRQSIRSEKNKASTKEGLRWVPSFEYSSNRLASWKKKIFRRNQQLTRPIIKKRVWNQQDQQINLTLENKIRRERWLPIWKEKLVKRRDIETLKLIDPKRKESIRVKLGE